MRVPGCCRNEEEALREAVQRFGIRTGSLEIRASSLSGGNQQKLAPAKVLHPDPRVVVLDEPTRGVDIGAKRDIYFLIHELAEEGRGVVVISSELIELIGLCDRVVVMRLGKVKATSDCGRVKRRTINCLCNRNALAPRFAAWPDQPAGRGPDSRTLDPSASVLPCIAGTVLNPDRYFRQRHERADPHGIHRHHRSGHVFRHHPGGIDLSVGRWPR